MIIRKYKRKRKIIKYKGMLNYKETDVLCNEKWILKFNKIIFYSKLYILNEKTEVDALGCRWAWSMKPARQQYRWSRSTILGFIFSDKRKINPLYNFKNHPIKKWHDNWTSTWWCTEVDSTAHPVSIQKDTT